MKKSRFTEEQIAYALKQVELGMAVSEVCRKMGIEPTRPISYPTLPTDKKSARYHQRRRAMDSVLSTCAWLACR